ncbi:hypothetical protein H920_09904 [Fukomys damarensis]|uniref:Uncharacterized protein n=1 Tax=Fukomys damarensis TaxID=885580 RepID=A0A091D9A3_FUKDA|nr:hypothetical protein H920_09904 [Fukomys damarensis]
MRTVEFSSVPLEEFQSLPSITDPSAFQCRHIGLLTPTPTGHHSELQKFDRILQAPVCGETLWTPPHLPLWVAILASLCPWFTSFDVPWKLTAEPGCVAV